MRLIAAIVFKYAGEEEPEKCLHVVEEMVRTIGYQMFRNVKWEK